MSLELFPAPDRDRVAYLRTSDRSAFKRCRRKWGFSSVLRYNLEPVRRPHYFWFGSGGHYALEDFHGFRNFDRASDAFLAYVAACRRCPSVELPDETPELVEQGVGMLDYYQDQWLTEARDKYKTLWVNGVPQVEVTGLIPLDDVLEERGVPFRDWGWEHVYYQFTLDRVASDQDGRLWILDYKFYARFADLGALELNQQISAYCWAAQVIYGQPLDGMIYQQHLKTIPQGPTFLNSGRYSVNKNQRTSHGLYKEALLNLYGSVEKAPRENVKFLDLLAAKESDDQDAYIRRDRSTRNPDQNVATGEKILMEAADMLNPDLPLYPNETKDCSWDCDFRDACTMIDDGSDWEHQLKATTQARYEGTESWRTYLKLPQAAEISPT